MEYSDSNQSLPSNLSDPDIIAIKEEIVNIKRMLNSFCPIKFV